MKSLVVLVALIGTATLTGAPMSGRMVNSPGAPAAVDSIESPAAPGSGEPNLVAGPDGRVYMTWLEPTADSGHALRFAVHDGKRWNVARTIATGRDYFVNWADFPSLEVLGDGRLAAHWLQRNGRGTYAYGVRISQSRDDGKTWSPALIPHRDTAQAEHGFVTMWTEKGKLGAVWLDGRKFDKAGHSPTSEMMLVSTTVDRSGALGAEQRLDERTCDCCQTAAAVTSSGPIIAYRDRSPEEIRDIYVIRQIEGKWVAPKAVHADGWKIAACPVNGPAVVAKGDRVALAWFTGARDTARVKIAFSTNAGASFGPPVVVDGGNPAGRVDVALLPDGAALVSWIERSGGDTAAVRVRRVSGTGALGAPITVATSSAARASGFPRMVVTGDHALFAWTVPGRPSSVRVGRASLAALR